MQKLTSKINKKLSPDWQTKAKHLFPNSTILRIDSGPERLRISLQSCQTWKRKTKQNKNQFCTSIREIWLTRHYKTKCWVVSTSLKLQVFQHDHRNKNHFKMICFMKQTICTFIANYIKLKGKIKIWSDTKSILISLFSHSDKNQKATIVKLPPHHFS